jgi:hypothetical protein
MPTWPSKRSRAPPSPATRTNPCASSTSSSSV